MFQKRIKGIRPNQIDKHSILQEKPNLGGQQGEDPFNQGKRVQIQLAKGTSSPFATTGSQAKYL